MWVGISLSLLKMSSPDGWPKIWRKNEICRAFLNWDFLISFSYVIFVWNYQNRNMCTQNGSLDLLFLCHSRSPLPFSLSLSLSSLSHENRSHTLSLSFLLHFATQTYRDRKTKWKEKKSMKKERKKNHRWMLKWRIQERWREKNQRWDAEMEEMRERNEGKKTRVTKKRKKEKGKFVRMA